MKFAPTPAAPAQPALIQPAKQPSLLAGGEVPAVPLNQKWSVADSTVTYTEGGEPGPVKRVLNKKAVSGEELHIKSDATAIELSTDSIGNVTVTLEVATAGGNQKKKKQKKKRRGSNRS